MESMVYLDDLILIFTSLTRFALTSFKLDHENRLFQRQFYPQDETAILTVIS